MATLEQECAETGLSAVVVQSLEGYQSTVQLWREASHLLLQHGLLKEDGRYCRVWPTIKGYEQQQRQDRPALIDLKVSVADIPHTASTKRLAKVDHLGSFLVHVGITNADGMAYRKRRFGGRQVVQSQPCYGNAILQDPDLALITAARATSYAWWHEGHAENLCRAADQEAAVGQDMFKQVVDNIGDIAHEGQFDRFASLAGRFAALLTEAQA